MILTHQKGRGTKVHLFLDGEYAATTDENCWLDNYISNGADIELNRKSFSEKIISNERLLELQKSATQK